MFYAISQPLFDVWLASLLRQLLEQSRQGSLGGRVGLQDFGDFFFLDVVVRKLVQGIIGEVHVNFLEILLGRLCVLLGAKSGQAFVGYVCLHLALINAHHDHVYPEVEFEAVHEKRVIDVLLDHYPVELLRAKW